MTATEVSPPTLRRQKLGPNGLASRHSRTPPRSSQGPRDSDFLWEHQLPAKRGTATTRNLRTRSERHLPSTSIRLRRGPRGSETRRPTHSSRLRLTRRSRRGKRDSGWSRRSKKLESKARWCGTRERTPSYLMRSLRSEPNDLVPNKILA